MSLAFPFEIEKDIKTSEKVITCILTCTFVGTENDGSVLNVGNQSFLHLVYLSHWNKKSWFR